MITTYDNGHDRVNLSDGQIEHLEIKGQWIRNKHGHLTSVYFGRHHGHPTFDKDEFDELINGGEVRGFVVV